MPIETEPHQAKAVGHNMPVSWKDVTEIGRFLKDDSVEKAKDKLQRVIEEDLAVPYTKFDSGAGHHSGSGKSRYPKNAAEEVLQVLESAESNAEHEGLNTGALEIQKFITNQGQEMRTPGRQPGRKTKAAHLKLVVGER